MPSRFSDVAHEGIVLWNPLPEDETLRVADGLRLAPTARVLDVGCGRAEILIRLLARTGASGLGVDVWPQAVARAREAARGRVDASRIELREERFDAATFGEGSFDAALCVGSTHAAGGLHGTLRAFRRLLVPGGVALVGEGFWMSEPDPAYLAFLGSPRESLLDRAGNLAAAREAGFDIVHEVVTSPRDFDSYEDRYAANVERFVAENPDDPDAAAFLTRIREWRAAYLQWGRRTLGFALYELRRG